MAVTVKVRGEALAVQGARLPTSAVACFTALGWGWRSEDLGVVGAYDRSHVLGTAVADLDGVSVEYAPVPVPLVEVDVHELEYLPSKLGFEAEVEGGVEPHDFPGPLLLCTGVFLGVIGLGGRCGRWWLVLKHVVFVSFLLSVHFLHISL